LGKLCFHPIQWFFEEIWKNGCPFFGIGMETNMQYDMTSKHYDQCEK
jgi:hypothetical protein